MEWWYLIVLMIYIFNCTQLNSECCQCENTCYVMRAQVLERANLTSIKPRMG